MSDHEFDSREKQERSHITSYSKPEHDGVPSKKTMSRPQSPSLSCSATDLASSSGSEGKSANYFKTLDATLDALQSRAQSLIDKINEGRNKDQALMKSFNDSLALKVTELSQRLEDRMYQLYDHNNRLLQERLQELPETIERIEHLQAELKQVCQTVATVYKDLCLESEI